MEHQKKYQIIYADPPWEYRQSGSEKNSRGMAKQKYNTMTTEDICKLPIKQIKTDNAVCLMWATFPNIDQALIVMKSWGFEYKTACFVWVKKNKKSNTNFWGMGAYSRANAEVCLLGISENTKSKQMVKSHAVHSIIESPIREHSKKPDETRDKIIELFGDLPRIELFSRQKIDGWDCWGNEVESDVQLIATPSDSASQVSKVDEHNISLKDNSNELSQMSNDTSLNNNIKSDFSFGLQEVKNE